MTRDVAARRLFWENKSQGYIVTQFYAVTIADEAGARRILGGTQDNVTQFFRDAGMVPGTEFTASSRVVTTDGTYGYLGENFAFGRIQWGACGD